MMLPLVESFPTLSGEAPTAGRPVFLIRLAGCNLDCAWCDTPQRHTVSRWVEPTTLRTEVLDWHLRHPWGGVLLTGGEPLLPERSEVVWNWIESLGVGVPVWIETNGTCPVPVRRPVNAHLVLDWKAPSAGALIPFCEENLPNLQSGRDVLKWVCGRSDLDWAARKRRWVGERWPELTCYLSPLWEDLSPQDAAEWILEGGHAFNLSLQLHKVIWGSDAQNH